MTCGRFRASTGTRSRWLAGLLALLAGLLAIAISVLVFPYYSINHDEAVYLQQAALLLEGRLFLRPPVAEAFRPWFFVEDGGRLYSKYAPVPAAIFALGELVGSYRLALAPVAATVVGLTYAVVAETFDRRRGLLAAAFVLASPLFLVQSGVFLPYLPTMALNLVFAFAYLRADRTGSLRWAALAGAAIGLAFFARPFTAALFAAPFVVHAGWTLHTLDRATVRRQSVTALLGVVGVAVALGYNATVTGSPLVFPYEAFAPLDGVGFGRRALLGYSVEYTPALALRANAEVLWVLFAGWIAAGPVGTALAVLGLLALLAGLDRFPPPVAARRLAILALLVSVPLGNLAFWGNLNVLGSLADPTDGLISNLGPYYHVDLLLPTAVLAAHGAVVVAGRTRVVLDRRFPADRADRLGLVLAVVAITALVGTGLAVAAGPIAENRAASDQLAAGYEPFEERPPENALVFLPTPLGDWLNHPFQALRNDPGYGGPVVYAIEERPFDVVDAFPNRTVYRYGYHGDWTPTVGEPVSPRLQRVRTASGERVVLNATLGIPEGVETGSIRISTAGGTAYYPANVTGSDVSLRLVVDASGAELTGLDPARGETPVRVGEEEPISIEVFLEYPDGSGVTYRIELPVAIGSGGDVRTISPRAAACLDPTRCGPEAIGVPDDAPTSVHLDTGLSAD